MASASPEKILVARGGALGDFILTLPVLAALRRRFPGRALEILGYECIASLAVAGGLADRVAALESPALAGFFVRDGDWPVQAAEYFAGFELIVSYVFDPENIFQVNVARCSTAQFLAGPHRPDESGKLHATKVLLEPLESLGLGEFDLRPRLDLPGPVEVSSVPRFAVHPGSGGVRKNWPEVKWGELLQKLAAATEWNFLLIGGEAEGGRCERLAAALPPRRVRLAQNLPLVELAQRMRSCAAFLGHDSGVTHLAAALDLPMLVLWGPSNEIVWRPMSDRMRVLRDSRGLDALPVQRVLRAAQRLAARGNFRPAEPPLPLPNPTLNPPSIKIKIKSRIRNERRHQPPEI
ncbi:MAG TPA: glycosyltransferase family 9 protein [Candidatus Cybelea sp.]|nr:glycosyltransferase family 9 protein [Candidatus Cybelea sp.]